jgi:hypothetical protein
MLSPLSMKTPTRGNFHKSIKGTKGRNKEGWGEEKGDSSLKKNDPPHQDKSDNSSSSGESYQDSPGTYDQDVSSPGEKGKNTDGQNVERNQGGGKLGKQSNDIVTNEELHNDQDNNNDAGGKGT